jgi:hypothetical protein
MFRDILKYGLIAGLVIGGFNFALFTLAGDQPHFEYGMYIGYTAMLVALSTVFLGIKRQRDVAQGGVIRFWPAFGMGLAISFIAGIIYDPAWEARASARGTQDRRRDRRDGRRDRAVQGDLREPVDAPADGVRGDLPGRRAGVAGVGAAAAHAELHAGAALSYVSSS